MASYEDSYGERQEDEVEFLEAMFPGDFRDLRDDDSWKVCVCVRVKERKRERERERENRNLITCKLRVREGGLDTWVLRSHC